MDYSLTKLLPLLVFPLGLALLFNLAGLVAFGLGKRKTGGMISFSAITYLWLASSPQIADWMMSGLEQDYPRTPSSKLESVEAIVMLGGGVERLIHTARLYNQGKAPVVYASGGGARLSEPEALTLMNLLIAMGLPEEVIVRESSSRNTYENAKNTSRLLAENNIQRILLVTSAFHMRRATAVFEQFG
ncbi:MAG: YdcF family protein, partial [bacterium]